MGPILLSLYQGDKLLVYGGENEHREYLSDRRNFGPKKSPLDAARRIQGPIPKGRARHAAVVYEDKLFIIGGLTGRNQLHPRRYLFLGSPDLDLESRTWSFVQRFDHASAWIWAGRLWVLGGMGHDMERSSELSGGLTSRGHLHMTMAQAEDMPSIKQNS